MALIYSDLASFDELDVPDDAPPLFICGAGVDNFTTVQASMDIYNRWLERGFSAALHLYAKGGHRFGYKKDQTPLNTWFDTFGD